MPLMYSYMFKRLPFLLPAQASKLHCLTGSARNGLDAYGFRAFCALSQGSESGAVTQAPLAVIALSWFPFRLV